MFQPILFWYIALFGVYIAAFGASTDLKRFFFFSETVWLAVIMAVLGSNLIAGSPVIIANALFILIFTACEAVVLASILLIASGSAHPDKFVSGRTD